MIRNRVRSLLATGALALTAVLAAQSAATPQTASATGGATSATPRPPAVQAAQSVQAAAARFCPQVGDPLFAAADRTVDIGRITPEPSYRHSCEELYRSDGRSPDQIFEEGFQPKAPRDGQYDLAAYVLKNQPSPYVSTSYDHDLYKQWRPGYNYYIDAPGGIDVNATIGDTHKWAAQHEVAFPGGIDRRFIVGACPVDKATKTEQLPDCVRNPNYLPWRGIPAQRPGVAALTLS